MTSTVQVCARCRGDFEGTIGGFCSDACLREGLSLRLAAIWDRMPADARARAHNCFGSGVMTTTHAIELWESADRIEQRGAPYEREDAVARDEKQDELDELLLSRASKGEYGPEAVEAVKNCMGNYTPGTSRRALLRAVRKAIEARRHGGGGKPPGRGRGADHDEQAALPLGGTGTDGGAAR